MKQNVRDSLDKYAADRIPTGGFLQSVLENDLVGALGRADPDNKQDIAEIVQYIYNFLPHICWGSPERVKKWLKGKT